MDREHSATLLEGQAQGPTKRLSRGGASYTLRQLFETWPPWNLGLISFLIAVESTVLASGVF